MIGSFTEVKPMFYWVQHILPLVYDDSLSYMELLGKVTKTLNELVENNSLLPDYIMKLIKEYISSGEIEKVLAEVLSNYMLNVKFPPKGLTPAVGDGSADDTEAIQGCINYAYQNGGMAVYFPSGAYLTQPLTLNEKVTLFGQDRYTTRIVMKGGATKPLFTGTVDEMSLTGLGFDGNMDIQVNNVNLFTITVNSAIITNCLLTDGYDLLNITVNNELQLDNILFRHAVENALVVGGAGYVQGDNLIFKSLSTLIGKNYVVLNTNKSILEEVKCFGAAPNGVLIGGNSNVVNMWCEACQTPYVDNGTNNTVHVYSVMEDEKFTGNVTQYIGGSLTQTVVAGKTLATGNVKDTANGTREESTTGNKTETVNGTKSVVVLRSLDENIGTDKISVVKGTKTETITGLYTENANGGKALISTDYNENVINRNITAAKIEETLTGNKTVTAANITETVSGDRTINGGDITHTGDNITLHAKTDMVFQTDGNKTDTVVGNIGERSNNKTETVTDTKTETVGTKNVAAANGETHTGKRMAILTNEALQYSKPTPLPDITKYFNFVPMIDRDNVGYNLVTQNENTLYLDGLLDFYYADVTDYGADATGTRDSTASIQNALDSGKGTVVFPPGNYICNWAKIPSNTHLIGYGASLTTEGNIIFANKADGVTGGWEANHNITIEGFDFHAENAPLCTPCGFGHMTNLTIRNCTFHDIKVWHFIEINSCKSSTIDNCKFWNYGTTEGGFSEMIQFDFMHSEGVFPWFGPYDKTINQDIKVVNCTFIGTPSLISGNVPAGIGNHTGDGANLRIFNVEVTNCYFEGLADAMKFINVYDMNMHDCVVNGCSGGVYFGGMIGSVNINSNYMVGRSDYDTTTWKRGVWIEYVIGANDTNVSNNYIGSFGLHGVTVQGASNKILNNVVIKNGGHGIYSGWNEFGTLISGNQVFSNNQLNSPTVSYYDLKLRLTRENDYPASLIIGDIAITNNKFSSAEISNAPIDGLGTYNKCYFANNFCKYTLLKNDTGVVVYSDNYLNFEIVDPAVNPNIGKIYSAQIATPVNFTAKGWNTVLQVTLPVAGVYSIDAYVTMAANPSIANKGSVRVSNARNSFEYSAVEGENREVYAQVTATRRFSAGAVVTLDIWAVNAGTATASTYINATMVAQ